MMKYGECLIFRLNFFWSLLGSDHSKLLEVNAFLDMALEQS